MTPEKILGEVKRLHDLGKDDGAIAKTLSESLGRKVSPKNVQGARRLMGWLQPIVGSESTIDMEYLLREFDEARPATREAEIAFTRRMAGSLGVDYRTVRRLLVAKGRLEPLPVTPLKPEDLARAKAMLESGMPYSRVAKETGISKTTLGKRFPGYGVRSEDFGAYMSALHLEKKLGLST